MTLTTKANSPCRRNYGWGWEDAVFIAEEYDCDNVRIIGETVHFTLNDKDGWIGDYQVPLLAFEPFTIPNWQREGF